MDDSGLPISRHSPLLNSSSVESTSRGKANAAYPSDQCYGLTKQQLAAVELKVPDSGLAWLDEMILKAKRDDLAKQMYGLVYADYWETLEEGSTCADDNWPEEIAAEAYRLADAMLRVSTAKQQGPSVKDMVSNWPEWKRNFRLTKDSKPTPKQEP